MKIEHAYQGKEQFCLKCNAPKQAHRGPRKREYKPGNLSYFGIDGEGQTDKLVGLYSGFHRYVMLCAADEHGHEFAVENEKGLSTNECLEFMAALPKRNAKFFAYSFNYDLTKILEDVDDKTLYRLIRPELRRVSRKERKVLAPVFWPAHDPKWSFNWINGRFTLKKLKYTIPMADPATGKTYKKYVWDKPLIIHDVWKFFQGKFTTALEDWKVPDNVPPEKRKLILDRMREMKDKRAEFDTLSRKEIRDYCFGECRYMGTLARKLTEAHFSAKIPLKNYFGAGSSAEAMLLVMNVKDHIELARKQNPISYDVEYAQRCAFFGGRFENSRIGAVPGKTYGKDISSAYPYQLVDLPCLIHGRWEHTTDRKAIDRARTALVRYTLEEPLVKRPWAPFPFRLKNGSITFPETSGGGWVWREEFKAGEKLFDNVKFQEAWLYHTDCDCQPFKDIPKYYAARVAIGKEGPGIVIKLGTNSCYGKTAQTIGGEPGTFHSWMWAGLITSGCRAQVLEAMAAHRDLDNLLMIATDGIASLEQIILPQPRDTGTNWIPCPDPDPKDVEESPEVFRREDGHWFVNKPLGGWEEKILPKGLFLARPGIYFPLEPTEKDIKRIRARGLGRAAVWDNWAKIVEAYENGNMIGEGKKRTKGIQIQNLNLFRGMKTSITRSGTPGNFTYKRSEHYGRWISRSVDMTFNPIPKREKEVGEGGRLRLRRLEGESAPYDKGILSPEAQALLEQSIEAEEQPDGGDFTDFGVWDE